MLPTWEMFYPNTPSFKNHTTDTRISTSSAAYFIFSVLFTTKNDRVIYFGNSDSNRVLLINTNFCNVTGNTHGQSLYVIGGQCVQYHVCNYKPKTSSNEPHSWVMPSGGRNNKNYILECSISCPTGNMPCSAYHGDNYIGKLNTSNGRSSFECLMRTSGDSSSHLCSVNYSTFYNNMATSYSGGETRNVQYKYCKYINNSHNSGSLLDCRDNILISDVVFKGNKGEYLFKQSGQIIATNVYLENNTFTYSPASNIVANTSFDLYLKHISTYLCGGNDPINVKFDPTDCVKYLSEDSIAFTQFFTQ
ncbi:hypothetical protein TVAG_130100 [Trichomonas vaginalis G3]|uniref:Uncharacterized protein n=1 Tax=Trichomonas vaginalis (strain ATCC PRA-98 / G3) TaxID=412133 RepID=A2DIA6_TRIV3|nr:hypothetical protein TVAGG3_0711900 [Trichomonas vaginalis G3]EAY19902.1 hypothetical protein TVAG_130100 [Trichomonas vaginalis G3]KAI5509964.1 hypothetical protein TVAGG3_0711900 [Trichomonas vaginalis G3]|eukprot:XP_001580888.1 hypothetical protein [Trichomonas vaginalis G3]